MSDIQPIVIPNEFEGGTTARADKINQNFEEFRDKVNEALLTLNHDDDKLSGIDDGAQINIIEVIEVDGIAQPVVNKTANIPVQDKINVETARAQAAEDALDNTKIDKSIAGEAGTLLQAITIKEDDASTVIVTGWSCDVNEASDPIPTDVALPIVDEDKAGVAPASLFNQVLTNTQELTILKNDAVAVELESEYPTQDELNEAYEDAAGLPVTNGAALFDITFQIRYGYYANISTWVKTSNAGGATTISIATNNILGIVKGSTSPGQNFVETDGTTSLNGYDDIITGISNLDTGKVDKNGTDSLMSEDEHNKLAGIEAGAQVNVNLPLLMTISMMYTLEGNDALNWTLAGLYESANDKPVLFEIDVGAYQFDQIVDVWGSINSSAIQTNWTVLPPSYGAITILDGDNNGGGLAGRKGIGFDFYSSKVVNTGTQVQPRNVRQLLYFRTF
jgi:hypothetical protein